MEILFLNPVFKEAIRQVSVGELAHTSQVIVLFQMVSLKEKLYHGFMKITENYLETFRITYFHY